MDESYCDNACELCGAHSERLVSIYKIKEILGVEFVCDSCFAKELGVSFEEYGNEPV